MKKLLAAGVLSIALLTACKNETPVAPAEPAPVSTPAPSAPEVTPPTPEESDGTSVKVGSDGLSVDSKDGSKKTSVELNNGGAAVEVKK